MVSNLDTELKDYQNPPRYKKLVGDLNGAYSRRINVQQRFIYEIINDEKIVKILRMWTHYEQIMSPYKRIQ